MYCNKQHNETVLAKLKPGDLVEIPRGGYSHWGVFVGDEDIVHLTGMDGMGVSHQSRSGHSKGASCGELLDKASVTKQNFWDVVGKDKAYKNNNTDRKYTAKHPREVVKNALSKVGEVGYNVISSNCEHFAKSCRYGVEKSDQVDNFVTGAALVGVAGVALGGAWLISKLWGKEEDEDEKEKKTRVMKLP